MKIYISVIFAILVNINPGFSQQLFTNTNVKKAVERGTRTATGMPGKNYWQNKADYDIKVHFDPATQLLEGKQSITYYNNSPDTLKTIIIRLYPNPLLPSFPGHRPPWKYPGIIK